MAHQKSLSVPDPAWKPGQIKPHGIPLNESLEKLKEINAKLDKVSMDEKEDVLRCFGEFMSFEEIKWHVVLTQGEKSVLNDIDMIERLCRNPNSRLTIAHYRGKYLRKLEEEPIFHKKVRLVDLGKMRDRYLKQIALLRDDDKYEREEFRYAARGLAEILSRAQDEVEGKGMHINVGMGIFDMGDLDGKSDDELISRREELLAKAARAIGGAERRRIAGDNADTEDVIDTVATKSS